MARRAFLFLEYECVLPRNAIISYYAIPYVCSGWIAYIDGELCGAHESSTLLALLVLHQNQYDDRRARGIIPCHSDALRVHSHATFYPSLYSIAKPAICLCLNHIAPMGTTHRKVKLCRSSPRLSFSLLPLGPVYRFLSNEKWLPTSYAPGLFPRSHAPGCAPSSPSRAAAAAAAAAATVAASPTGTRSSAPSQSRQPAAQYRRERRTR